ncbi:MAG: DUF4446 family protein [Eubacterium sp.]|nr:DUF4446 family protein [Eubacterium sp.]
MNEPVTVFGIRIEIIVIVLLVLIIVLAVALFFTIRRLEFVNRKYYTIMSGKKGKDLEKVILTRFKEMDKVKNNARRVTSEHKKFKGQLDSCINKIGLVRYDAFDNLAGSLSFSLALLNQDNSGVVLNTMHSRDGCYSYAKEIIKGESYITLSEEEKEAIKKAMTVEEEIEALTTPDETFDID